MPTQQSKGQIEAAISKAMIQFEREHMGRGPRDARTWLIQDMVLVRLLGVLTPAEEKLAQEPEGKALLKQVRTQLIESSRSLVESIVLDITGVPVISLHSDVSTRTGERIILLTMAENLEMRFGR
jgi:uncharacterized protein YbcI